VIRDPELTLWSKDLDEKLTVAPKTLIIAKRVGIQSYISRHEMRAACEQQEADNIQKLKI
jgi:hypothetical protein